MSHAKKREASNCLNCGANVQSLFCPECGQENVEFKEGFLPMAKHFVFDILHFDGKFFFTLKHLLFYPGKVAKEFVAGRRNTYLDPVRMYLFVSTMAFFLFPLFFHIQETVEGVRLFATPTDRLREASRSFSLLKEAPSDSLAIRKLNVLLDSSSLLRLRNKPNKKDSSAIDMVIGGKVYRAAPLRDSQVFVSNTWWDRRISENMRKKYEATGDFQSILSEAAMTQQKMLPYILFISLPVFSFILQLLYRRKRSFYFSDHAFFTLYHYIVWFILLVAFLFLQLLLDRISWDTPYVSLLFLALLLLFLAVEMKRFYGEKWGSTILKFLALTLLSLLTFMIIYGVLSVLILMF